MRYQVLGPYGILDEEVSPVANFFLPVLCVA
jgi:hypothetical protein